MSIGDRRESYAQFTPILFFMKEQNHVFVLANDRESIVAMNRYEIMSQSAVR
jgi:hypothetical protein